MMDIMARYVCSYARPIADKEAVVVDSDREKRAIEVFAVSNVLEKSTIEPAYYEKFYNQVGHIYSIRHRMRADDVNYTKLFFEKNTTLAVTKSDVADYCLVFFLYYHFGIAARDLMLNLCKMYRQFKGSRKENAVTILELMKIVFMKPNMFG